MRDGRTYLALEGREELAVAIIEQSDPNAAGGGGGGQQDLLQRALQMEQRTLVSQTLELFGHKERRASLPKGTVQECLA